MGNWNSHSSSNLVKLLQVGDSGAGKTTQLGLLANAGYKVVIADFANGLDALGGVLTPEGANNVFFVTFRDNVVANEIGAWVAFKSEMRKGEWAGAGPITSWGGDTVFAVDDLSGATDAAKHYALKLNGKKPHERPSLPDWGNINDELDVYIMQSVIADNIGCNVILNTHWQPVDDDLGASRFYPRIGTKANGVNNCARHMNNVVWIKANKRGERVFKTGGDNSRDLKTSRRLELELPANMPALFETLRS